jgi:BRO family, N-terminal domain
MIIINEPAVYKLIMRSNKPNAQPFQEFVCGEILPSIRKKGEYKIDDERKMILNRPIKQLLQLSEIDVEAEKLEMEFDIFSWSSKCIIYLAYIGKGLVKVGFSDRKSLEREKKHMSCESKYEQFRYLKAFEISGKPIDTILKNFLQRYKVVFHNLLHLKNLVIKLNRFY